MGQKESGAWRAACKMLAAAGDQAHALVVRMVTEGTLPAGMMWVGLSGAAAFVAAIARGDIAPLEVHEARDRECLRCSARTPVKNADGFERRGFVGYCGEPLVERMGGPVEGRSCGCLLDAANAVASHECPRRRFVAVSVDGGPRGERGGRGVVAGV